MATEHLSVTTYSLVELDSVQRPRRLGTHFWNSYKSQGLLQGIFFFGGGEIILLDTVVGDTWQYAFVKTHETVQHKKWTPSMGFY